MDPRPHEPMRSMFDGLKLNTGRARPEPSGPRTRYRGGPIQRRFCTRR